MAMKQISIFLENKPGTLEAVTDILRANNIDMRALSLADSADYGIVRVLVQDTDRALKVLSENGYLAKVNDVLAVSIDDAPGGLASVIKVLSENHINIEYLYVFVTESSKKACAVFRVQNVATAEDLLRNKHLILSGEGEL